MTLVGAVPRPQGPAGHVIAASWPDRADREFPAVLRLCGSQSRMHIHIRRHSYADLQHDEADRPPADRGSDRRLRTLLADRGARHRSVVTLSMDSFITVRLMGDR